MTGLLALPRRFTAEVMGAELVTGVAVFELFCTLLASVSEKKERVRLKSGLSQVPLSPSLSLWQKANSPCDLMAV